VKGPDGVLKRMAIDYDLLVLNGIVITDKATGEFDIAVIGEKIVKVVSRGELSGASARRTIDANGGFVMASYEVNRHSIFS